MRGNSHIQAYSLCKSWVSKPHESLNKYVNSSSSVHYEDRKQGQHWTPLTDLIVFLLLLLFFFKQLIQLSSFLQQIYISFFFFWCFFGDKSTLLQNTLFSTLRCRSQESHASLLRFSVTNNCKSLFGLQLPSQRTTEIYSY